MRRERTGHIQLVVPVAHIWYFRSLPNKIGYLLGMPSKKLDAIVYYEKYIIIQTGALEGVADVTKGDLIDEDKYIELLESLPRENQLLDDDDPNKFIAKMGAEAIYDLLATLDFDTLSYEFLPKADPALFQHRTP